MRAVLKGISSDQHNLETWAPEDPSNFFLDLILRIGVGEGARADNFTVLVCTPAWLAGSVWSPRWGRGSLIVYSYDFGAIRNEIESLIASCVGESWIEIAQKLSRNLLWEFEDYVE